MRTKRNWLRTTIAMLTLVATVLETGFTSVQTLAAEITTEDGIVVNNDAVEETSDESLDISVEPDNGDEGNVEVSEASEDETFDETDEEYSEEVPDEVEAFEEAEELREGTLDVSDGGITGSGYDEISVYVDTDELANKDKFRIEFTGPASASYNPVLNEDLDKTNGGRYDFEGLEGGDFTIRAKSSDKVILSYSYNENGYPLIKVKSEEAEKVLTTKLLTAKDDSRISAISGEGYDSVRVEFATDNLSDKSRFKLVVESDADATVNDDDAKAGIAGLSKNTGSLVINDLDGESFVAYVVSDSETKLETVAEVVSIEDGTASIEINDVAVKRVYEYEDAKIYVRATLEKAEAVPDDAYFDVAPLTDEEAEKYLAKLNKDLDEGQEEYTADNSLLYDMGFYTDESKSEAIEPEEGFVKISVDFKKAQLKSEIDATQDDGIEVVHFEEDGNNINPVIVDAEVSVQGETADFELNSFSVILFKSITEVKPGTSRSVESILGDAIYYGVTANSLTLGGHMDTNFAVGELKASCNTTQGVYTGSHNPGNDILAKYSGSGWFPDCSSNKTFKIVTTPEVASVLENNTNITARSYINIDSDHTYSELSEKVSDMVGGTLSSALANEGTTYDVKTAATHATPGNTSTPYLIDISDLEAGTYYFTFKEGEYNQVISNGGPMQIRLNQDQIIVFNIPDESVELEQFYIDLGNGMKTSAMQNADADEYCQHVVWNLYNATSTGNGGSILGIVLAPNGHYAVGGTSTGWLVANSVQNGGEWHMVWQDMPEMDGISTRFYAKKTVNGNEPVSGEEFTFDLYSYDWTSKTYSSEPIDSVTNNGGTIAFDTIQYPASDFESITSKTYSYKIVERATDNEGYEIDSTQYIVHVKVRKENNALKIYETNIYTDGGKTFKGSDYSESGTCILFDNKTTAEEVGSTSYTIGVRKNLVNGITSSSISNWPTSFTFKVTKYTSDSVNSVSKNPVLPSPSEITITGDTAGYSASFGTLEFDAKEVFESSESTESSTYSNKDGHGEVRYLCYKYRISEVVENKSGITYDSIPDRYLKLWINAEKKTENGVTKYSVWVEPKYSENNVDCVDLGTNPIEFTNKYSATGNTTIYGHKTLEGRTLKAGEFTFTLSSTDDPKFDTRVASKSVTNDADGNFDFGVMNYNLEDAGKSYTYTVEETKGTDSTVTYSTIKYDVTVTITDNGDGTLAVVQDRGAQNARLSFVNVYGAKGEAVFQATKKYKSGSALSTSKEFSFTLAGDKITPQTKTVKGEGSVTFDTIKYADLNAAGTYNYTIKEVIPTGADASNNYTVDGVVYDNRTYNIKVVVSDNGTGVLQKTITADYDNSNPTTVVETVNPEFVNDYKVDSITTVINGTKALVGKALSEGDYSFILSAYGDTAEAVTDGKVELPAVTEVSNKADRTFEFGAIKFNSAGTYRFLITENTENDTEDDDITYDASRYVVTVVVKDNGSGDLVVDSRTIGKEGEEGSTSSIIFNNTFNGNGEITLFAEKELTGRTLEAGQFSFELKNSEGTEIGTPKYNDASGKVTFDPLKFSSSALGLTEPGQKKELTYTISETAPEEDSAGYKYDRHEEKVNVTVTLNADGSLNVEADNATATRPARFKNTYSASGTAVIEGTKKITGRKFTNKDNDVFTAELYDEGGNKIGSAPITKSTAIFGDKGGEFHFDPITYTEPGTYRYTVKETGTANNITNDDTVISVTVTVTDNGDGTLTAVVDKTAKEINFNNTYAADGTAVIKARKRVNGEFSANKLFKFDLTDVAQNKVIDTKKNEDGGWVTFKTLEFTQGDLEDGEDVTVKEYRITEQAVDAAGYSKLNEVQYTAKVLLSVKDDGTLETKVKYYDAAGAEIDDASVVFDNKYEATGTVDLYVSKTLTGRDMTAGQFTFSLYNENDEVVERAANVAAGAGQVARAAFPQITYTVEDLNTVNSHQIGDNKYARYYYIKENIPEGAVLQTDGTYRKDGYTYDGSVYNVVVTLEDKGNGTIETDWYSYKSGTVAEKPSVWDNIVEFFTKEKSAGQAALFENNYEAEGALDLIAQKILSGKELVADAFEFTLSGKDEEGRSFIDTKANAADGSVTFDRIRYTKPGEYEYTIEEVVPSNAVEDNGVKVLNGVRYSGKKYTVNVEVTDQNTGKLKVEAAVNDGSVVTSAEVTDESGIVTSVCKPAAVIFRNDYDAKPVTVTFGGTKTLTGRTLADGEFTFALKSATGNTKELNEITTTNEGSSFSFPAIEYTFDDMANGDGTYADTRNFEYEVREVEPEEADKLKGVTYDTNTYQVVVTVTNANGILSATVTSNGIAVDADKVASFTNNYDADGTLTLNVSKTVEGTEANNKTFTFELTGDGITTPYTTTAVNGGQGSFAALSYRLTDLEKNTNGSYAKTYNYTVREVEGNDAGYDYSNEVYNVKVDVTSDGTSGELVIEKTITRDGQEYTESAMNFTNTYTAKGNVTIDGTKTLVGKELDEGDAFTFILSRKGDDGTYTEVENGKTTNDTSGRFSFTQSYTQDDVGKTYYYRVNEDVPANSADSGIDYDTSVYDIKVSIADNGDGTLKVTKSIEKDGNTAEKCSFTNTVVKPDSVTFTAEKILNGKAIGDDMFTFTLKGDGQDQIKTNKGNSVTFDPIEYALKDAGKTFNYTIEETKGNRFGITYDETKYTATVTVSLVDGALVIDKKIKIGDQKVTDIEFVNEYKSDVEVQFGGYKKLVGFTDGATPLGEYQFGLYDSNGNVVKVNDKEQIVTVAPGKAADETKYSFDTIKFDQDDYLNTAPDHKITYTVKELIPQVKAANVTYAENEYNITVVLGYDLDGKLTATVSTAEGVDPAEGLSFTNKYAAEGDLYLDGIKTITGKNLEDGAYTFTLTGEDQEQEVKNAGNAFTFEKIHYEARDIGEHVYTIAESAGTSDGSTADTKVYTVKVTVGEGADGKLDVSKEISYVDTDGETRVLGATDKMTFANTYSAKGELPLGGKKIMHNKPIKEGDYTFVLKDSDGNEIESVTCAAASLNNKKDLVAESEFEFTELSFTEEDLKAADGSYLSEITKYYTVEEVTGEKGGVTYSQAAYVVEVTIKSDGTDKLSVTKRIKAAGKADINEKRSGLAGLIDSLFGGSDKDDEIVFENTYDAVCIIDPPVLSKQIMGREIQRGLFSFKVTGPGLRSMGEEETGYERIIWNGINPATGDIYYTDSIRNGEEIAPGEIYVGDVKYTFIDLDIDLETGEASRTFEYIATEVDDKDDGVDSSTQEFKLVVTVTDNDDGTLTTVPALEDMEWIPLNEPALSDKDMKDTFLNVFNQFGYIDIPGVKKMEGRELNEDDVFSFTITDDATGESKTINNTFDAYGKPGVVNFRHDGEDAVPFLNYRYGAVENENGKLVEVDETGVHTYTIVEEETGKDGIVRDTAAFKVTVDVQPVYDENGDPVLTSDHTGQLATRIVSVEKYSANGTRDGEFDFADGNYFEFKNKFTATGKIDFDGIKYLKDQEGNAIVSPDSLKDQYEFAIYQYDDAARTIGKTLVDTTRTAADGKFTLDVPEYTQEVLRNENGEYDTEKTLYYRIVEIKPSNGAWSEDRTVFESEGVIYDNTEYDVDVTVKYDGTSALKIDKAIKKSGTGEAVTQISYTNLVREYVVIEGNKFWVDKVKDPATRPDVEVHLYSSGVGNGIPIINTYTIKAPDTTYRFATDKDGNKLPAYDYKGRAIKYTVKEVPIDGYLAEQNGYDLINTLGDIMIRKIDEDTKAPLAGATLAIFDGSTEVERWTSGASAHVIESELTPGKTYTLREITAPEGYDLAEDMTFTAPSDGKDITVTMSDKRIIGSVRLTKRDATTRDTLAGAEFALYTDAGARIYATGSAGSYSVTDSTSNGVFVTDSAGSLVISDLPYGTYYFVETKAPEGYSLSSERLGFTVLRTGELVEVTYLDTKATGAVRLRKVGATGTRSLAGAVFELYAATPRSIGQVASSTIFSDAYYRYGTYRTNSAGEIYVGDLPWDDYYFIEVEAPDGYEIAADVNGDPLVYTFTVGAATADTTIDLGGIVNTPEETTSPPPGTATTPTPTPGVLGARIKKGGVVNGVLGVRAKPSSGVLGVRVGPVTGDASNIILWLLLLTACVATIVATIVTGRKKKTAIK